MRSSVFNELVLMVSLSPLMVSFSNHGQHRFSAVYSRAYPLLMKSKADLCFAVRLYRKTTSHFSARSNGAISAFVSEQLSKLEAPLAELCDRQPQVLDSEPFDGGCREHLRMCCRMLAKNVLRFVNDLGEVA